MRSRECDLSKVKSRLSYQLNRSYIAPCQSLRQVRPPDLQLNKLHEALTRRRAASLLTPRRSAQRWRHNQPSLAPKPVVVCCMLRAATVAAEVLHQSALAAQSHARAHAGRAGAGRTVANYNWATARGCAEQGASHSPHCRLRSGALPWSLTWDGVNEALLAEAALSCLLQRASCMQRHAAGMTGGHARKACAEVANAWTAGK